MQCKELVAQTALTKLNRKIPYGWDLNIYRGCQHSCRYCYAMYSHKYIGSDDFFKDIYVKTNIVDILEEELKSPDWKREVINIGGVTDSYQQAEELYKIMPQVLKLLIKYKTPAIISTKSKLVLRDYDLIDELSRITYINIAESITTTDEDVRMKIEPCSSNTEERFWVLKEFRKTRASIGVHLMPIIPFITDSQENLEKIFYFTADCGADYLLPGTLYLRGSTREYFFEFVKNEFPQFYEKLRLLYKTGGAGSQYKNELYSMVNGLREKYKVSASYTKPMKERLGRMPANK